MLRKLIKSIYLNFLPFFISLIAKKGNLQFSSTLIIAPHPDDEVLGLGGLITQASQSGKVIYILYLTDGESSGTWGDKKEIASQRTKLSEKVATYLDIPSSNIYRMHLEDGKIPFKESSGFNSTLNGLINIIEQIKPDVIFATHKTDYWPYDHVACANLAEEAVKKSKHNPELYHYWVWTWYNLHPCQLFSIKATNIECLNIKKQLKQKKKMIDIYLNSFSPSGKPWCGVLPKELIIALRKPYEVIEKIKVS